MLMLWPLKVPKRGNAITQRKTLEIEHRALPQVVFLIPCKNPYSNQATQKNTYQIFVPPKIPESKISNPKKSFNHPHHLKSWVPPLGIHLSYANNKTANSFSLFVFLSCFEVYKSKRLNSECLNPLVNSKTSSIIDRSHFGRINLCLHYMVSSFLSHKWSI